MTKSWIPLLAGLAVASACVELQETHGAAGSPTEDVGLRRAELGAWAERYYSESGAPLLFLNHHYAIFGGVGDSCSQSARQLDIVIPSTGALGDIPLLPNTPQCGIDVSAAFGSEGGIFVGDSKGKRIYRLTLTSQWTLTWQLVAMAPGEPIIKVLANSSFVFWEDPVGIHRAPIGGGSTTTLAPSSYDLLGIEGEYLYVEKWNTASEDYSLRKLPVNGAAPTTLRTESYGFKHGFTFNSSHFYFIRNSGVPGQTNRLYRLTKSGSSLTTYKSSTTVSYSNSNANESHLYWVERLSPSGTETLERVHLSSGSVSDVSTPLDFVQKLAVGPEELYVVGNEDDAPYFPVLHSGQL